MAALEHKIVKLKIKVKMEHENLNTPQTPPLQQTAVSGSLLEEKNCKHEYKCTLDTDWWSHYVCKKCGHSYIEDFD